MSFISICIPAYKRVKYLDRLLHSVIIQDFKDFEVIVTDDSPDNLVKELCEKHISTINLKYYKNDIPLGTPSNWNAAIKLAKGQWIKLMHDDDWFADKSSLQKFAEVAKNVGNAFIFSAYTNVFENSGATKNVFPEKFRLSQASKEPSILVAKNFIGPPSVVMHKNDGKHFYDPALKWLVDIDMYRRRLETDEIIYIDQTLINVYMSSSQVTSYTKNVKDVEIPEHFHFLNKMGAQKLKNIHVYDYNWRFIRNFEIRDIQQFRNYGYLGEIPVVLQSMISIQSRLPRFLLRNGFTSKLLMGLHYITHSHKIQ